MKIQTKIFSIIFLLVVVTGATAILAVRTIAVNTIRRQICNHLETTARSREKHIETFLKDIMEDIRAPSSSIYFVQLLTADRNLKSYSKKVKICNKRFSKIKKTFDDFTEVSLIDKKGIIVVSSDIRVIGQNCSREKYFIGGKKGLYLTDVYNSNVTGKPKFVVAHPVFSEKGEVLGVLSGRININNLFEITKDRTGLGKTGEIYIVNKNGYMITPSRFVKDAVLKQRVDTENTRSYFKHIKLHGEKKHEHDEFVFKNYVDKDVLGVHAHIRGIDWCLVTEMSKKEAFAPVTAMTNTMFIIFTAFLIAGILFTIPIAKTITDPILRLKRGVGKLKNGNLNYKVGTKAKDEIGELSRAFDTMAARLKKSREELKEYSRNLEKKVEKRTAKLKEEIKKSEEQRIETLNILQNLDEANENLKKQIAERKQLETHLRQAQKMEAIGTLAGGIAHDFNNILSAIIGYTELAEYDMPKDFEIRSNLRQVLKAGNRAKDLVSQILTFSRQGEQKKKPIQISLIVKETLKLLCASLSSNIDIRQNIVSTQGQDTVLADPTHIYQILMNLCTNAAHAMREKGGVLKVGIQNVEVGNQELGLPGMGASGPKAEIELIHGAYVRLTVSDSGHGIPSEVMERIFDPYFTTKGKGEGTGLGLATVYGIVKDYGGTVTVYSEPGKGSTFHVYLPAILKEEISEKETEEPISTGNECILFVDDEEPLAQLGKQMLTRLGYEVKTRTSSVEALQLFRVKPGDFDLVITDMDMPNMAGDELVKELIQIRPDIPIIMCTGFSEKISEMKTKDMGIRAVVMKPLVMRELAETIRRVLEE